MSGQLTDDARQVGEACTSFSTTIREALSWIEHTGNAERLGHEKRAIEEELRRTAFQASKLAQAVATPMCVGVFGPSQAGKSYLVSVLARKNSRLMAVFDDPRGTIDFIEELNPKGGREATGLVTRFTIHPIKTPPGFPVALRLLGQTDLVKVIVNSYANDGDLDLERLPTREELTAHMEEIEKAAGTDYADRLREEDIWDLQEYVQKHYRRIDEPLAAFWDRIAYLAPRVPLAKRAMLYSILWGRHEPLTRLYLKLADGLARLGFAGDAFAPMESLFPTDRSILNVDTLAAVASDTSATLQIAAANGATAELPRAVVAALTAELRIVAAERPWDFFDHTDLLDFPGYRSRKKEDLQKLFAAAPELTVAEMLLRGKVDYLFQRYTQDQELTSVLLCVRDSNLEVKTLPEVVEEWIGVTHGMTAPERVGRPTLLFVCLTMFDNHLVETVATPEERFAARMQASLIAPFGSKPGTWPANWTPGKPFVNCFWIRNPNVKAESVIEYDDWREVRIRPDKVVRLNEILADYGRVPAVQRHFKDPMLAWNEVMRLNDGGVSYLAGQLAQVCLPQIKTDQIRARLATLRKRTLDRLGRYYVTTDLDKRLREREDVCAQILEGVQESLSRNRFGTFVSGLCIDRVQLGDALYVARTTGAVGEPVAVNAGQGARPARSIASVLLGGRQAPALRAPQRVSGNIRLGHAAVHAWASHMQRMSESEPFGRAVGISTTLIREVVAEISGAARRKKLAEEIATQLDRILHLDSSDAVVGKTTLVASRILNGFVCTFGYDREPAERRPKVPLGEQDERPVFHRPSVVHDASGIGVERESFAFDYALDWCTALQVVIRENASTEDGSMQDPVQNARLGRILEGLHA